MDRPESENIWTTLEKDAQDYKGIEKRVYRRLDLKNENGLRIGLVLPEKLREIIIQIDPGFVEVPSWSGINCEEILLDVPEKNTSHLCIRLSKTIYKDIFSTIVDDLTGVLWNCRQQNKRAKELEAFFDRWNQFFKLISPEGLSLSRQQGLLGELLLIEKLLDNRFDPVTILKSWKGYKKNVHDFDIQGISIEVKTTKSKEPRKVWISNERQLDDQGLIKLFLFVLTFQTADSGVKLSEVVEKIRAVLEKNQKASILFERGLVASGYLVIHEHLYETGFVIRSEEFFKVVEGFPRIISTPHGTGDLTYSLTLSKCQDFKFNQEQILKILKKECDHAG